MGSKLAYEHCLSKSQAATAQLSAGSFLQFAAASFFHTRVAIPSLSGYFLALTWLTQSTGFDIAESALELVDKGLSFSASPRTFCWPEFTTE